MGWVSRSAGAFGLPRVDRRAGRQPRQLRHQHAGRLDAPDTSRLAGDDAAPYRVRSRVADHAAAAARAVRLRLCLLALFGVDGAGLLLRLAAHVGRYRQAPVHHRGHARAALADPAGRYVDDRNSPAARRASVDALAPTRLRDRGVRGPALSVAREGWGDGSLLVRGGARRPARRPRVGPGTAPRPPPPARRRHRDVGAGRLVGQEPFLGGRRAVVSVGPMGSAATVSVNGRSYHAPDRPVVFVCIDGSQPEYFERGLAAGPAPAPARLPRRGVDPAPPPRRPPLSR